jgi:hypothetical protein
MSLFPTDPKREPGRFRVGDRVRLTLGYRGAEAEILEDRGPLGPDHQRFYTIHVTNYGGGDDFIIDYGENEMELLTEPGDGQKEAVGRSDPKAGG